MVYGEVVGRGAVDEVREGLVGSGGSGLDGGKVGSLSEGGGGLSDGWRGVCELSEHRGGMEGLLRRRHTVEPSGGEGESPELNGRAGAPERGGGNAEAVQKHGVASVPAVVWSVVVLPSLQKIGQQHYTRDAGTAEIFS